MNTMKNLIQNGEKIVGAFVSEIASPNILRIMKSAGVQWVTVDCEHGYFDYSQVAALAAVANGIELPLFVRLAAASRESVQKYLDAGVDGLLMPMVATAEEALQLVRYGKYAPLGVRGISTMRPHSEYNPGKLRDYMEGANRRTLLFVQIETDEGVQNAGKIAAVEGIDGILIGPNDLASDYGTPGDFHTPQMEAALVQVVKAARAAGKPSGIIASNPDFLKACAAKGMTIFSCNSEVGLLHQGVRQMVAGLR